MTDLQQPQTGAEPAEGAPTVPSATVVADSVSPEGVRVTTIEVTLHRFVLAELNTHRVFSRNSASSRAIPIGKQIARVETDPAMPVEFGANQRGMQAGAPLEGEEEKAAIDAWLRARDAAVDAVRVLDDLGVHKQVANRILEPFMWHTVIVTATDWDGFWHQRCSPLAQPEIRVAAEAMREAFDASTPRAMAAGEWHTPYVRDDELDLDDRTKRRISAARCARVSYLTHDGRRDLSADEELYQRLVTADPPHWSPLEHVATPAVDGEAVLGNLRGWHQLRHRLDNAG
ncbi:Thymidylate synthase thyX [Euzebya pacifica]|uniref:Thymidylate synthase thyX n=1 Tax=Euzebya pacifica TaxID=1608957 RepID=A0A346Y0N0_9ACTN|nr:FAD-dependent thymidylate synthase [Euzebya pacifica]AXV08027.1 Thymidylate synthase thyX [Euzebya pacifica]